MIITIPKSGIVGLNEFKDLLDISKIVSYSLNIEDKKLVLKFYNNDGEIIRPYAKEKIKKTKSKRNKKA